MNFPQASLPIDPLLPRLLELFAEASAAILVAPPGSGKTTRIPPALLAAPWLEGQTILLLQPRRVAAVNAARYMAAQMGEEAGGTVGYAIRFERALSSRTRIEVVTEGVLTRRLQSDPELRGVGLVIFDEFHERHLDSDLGLALCRDAQLGLRPDLRLLVMSATLAPEPLARLLGGAPVLRCEGRRYPVALHYLPDDPGGPVPEVVARGVRQALRSSPGDVLAFLPGAGEIQACRELLADLAGSVRLCPLYGDLPFAQQQQALLPASQRRVVLATNLAETSLTIEGVGVVVDSGWERRARFDPLRGATVLERVRISQSSAEQRAGRAGRLGPGVCYRLWSEGTQGALLPEAPPAIRQADLAPLAFELARWGLQDPQALIWLDPPPAGHLAAARRLLRQLGALDGEERLTPLGRAMARYPAHPRIARLLLAAVDGSCPGLGAELAALLGERDPWLTRPPLAVAGESDLDARLNALNDPRQTEFEAVRRAARFWRRQLNCDSTASAPPGALTALLVAAFPDRVGHARNPGGERYLLANGQGVRLSSRAPGHRPEWLVAVEVRGRSGVEGDVQLAHPVSAAEVERSLGAAAVWEPVVVWDAGSQRVVAREVRSVGALVLQERPLSVPPEATAAVLLEVVRQRGLAALPWNDPSRQCRARLALLARLQPEGGWPVMSDDALLESLERWLGPALAGMTRWEELQRLDLGPLLLAPLDWSRRQALERLAPLRLEVPSGSSCRLDYVQGEVSVLAVKLQEMFGLAETPRVGGGLVPVQIHLLSPAGRPLAVTQDLRSFWQNGYPEIRREMKGRYPKHPWPDDPWNAPPTARTRHPRR